LQTRGSTLDEQLDDMDEADLPDYVLATYAPLSQRFRYWRFKFHSVRNYDESAICVLLMALVCPSFGILSVNATHTVSVLSPLRTLPLHVVQLIVDHVVGSIRVRTDYVKIDSNACKVFSKPLLQVCQNFCAVDLSLYCGHFKLNLCNRHWHRFAMQYMQTGCENITYPSRAYLGFPTHHLVKKLDIDMGKRAIYSGKVLRMLLSAPYNGCVFPLAHQATITFIDYGKESDDTDWPEYSYKLDEFDKVDSRVATANIVAFIQRIRLIAPMASRYALDDDGYGSFIPGDHELLCPNWSRNSTSHPAVLNCF
ncbi:hypothetical protein GGI21_003375, partial [Coemansia aciculifera]